MGIYTHLEWVNSHNATRMLAGVIDAMHATSNAARAGDAGLRAHACFSGLLKSGQLGVHRSNRWGALIKPNTWQACLVLSNVKKGLKRLANESAAHGSVTWLLIQTVAYVHIHPMVQNAACYNIQHLRISQSECSPRITDVALVPDPDRPFTAIQWTRRVRGFDGV